MPGFIKLLDRESVILKPIWAVKGSFEGDFDLEALMTVVEDLSKPQREFAFMEGARNLCWFRLG
jgi:hypothetical protein